MYCFVQDDMLLKWRQVIQCPKTKPLLKSNCVCELHFREEEIERYYITTLSDGSIFRMLKGKPSLKLGAVPSILLNGDAVENMSRPSTPMEFQCKLEIQDPIAENQLPLQNNSKLNSADFISEVQSPIHECALPVHKYASPPVVDQFSIAQNLYETIILPTKLWFSQVFSDKIIWAQWGDQCNTAFRVTLLQDMNLQIFVEDRRVYVAGLEKIETITEMSAVLRRVSTLLACSGVGVGTEGKTIECNGYVERRNSLTGPQRRRCKVCTKRRNQVMRKLRDNLDINTSMKIRCAKRSKQIKNALRRNFRLQIKMKKLQLKMRSLQQKCAKAKTKAVNQAIANLPDNQKIEA